MKKINRYLLILLFILLVIMTIWTSLKQSEHIKQTTEKNTNIYDSYGQFDSKDNGIAILCYHRISPSNDMTYFAQKNSNNSQLHSFNVNKNTFEKQMNYLKRNHIPVISLNKAIQLVKQGPLKKKYVVLTFDDIDQTIIKNALPLLHQYHFPYTCFIITGQMNQYLDGSYTASLKQIQQLNQNLCTLGIHTNNLHYQKNKQPILTQISLNQFKKDYNQALNQINQLCKTKPINHYFAPPYGAITKEEQQWLMKTKKANGILTLDDDLLTNHTSLSNIPRIIVTEKSFNHIKNWLIP